MSHKFDFGCVTLSRDEIGGMTSEDLQGQISRVRRMIKEARALGRDTTTFEIEYCYLDHERQKRMRYDISFARRSFRSGGN